MAEIEITLPTVQYGNVKVRATAEELGLEGVQDAGALGVAAAVYLNLFTQGFKVGTQIDVDYDGGATKPPPPAPIERVEVDPEELIKTQLGATEVEDEDEYDSAAEAREATQARTADAAPWNSPAVDVKPKPWETGKAAPTNAVRASGEAAARKDDGSAVRPKVAEVNW